MTQTFAVLALCMISFATSGWAENCFSCVSWMTFNGEDVCSQVCDKTPRINLNNTLGCFKINMKIVYRTRIPSIPNGPKNNTDITIRNNLPITMPGIRHETLFPLVPASTCKQIKLMISGNPILLVNETDIHCNECKNDVCNSATELHLAIFTGIFSAILIVYFRY